MVSWVLIGLLSTPMAFPQFQTRLYMVPAVTAIIYIFFNRYPFLAHRMHQRKLTYEDLEDFRDADPQLRRRFQRVFTRVQQIGGAFCGGMLVLYGFHVFDHPPSLFDFFGILGGILSLYARIFGYIGSFCITCLYRLKTQHQEPLQELTGSAQASESAHPDFCEPQDAQEHGDDL